MRRRPALRLLPIPSLLLALAPLGPASADSAGIQAYRAMGLRVGDVLSGTTLSARILPGDEKQVVTVVTFFTGQRDQAGAVNVRLEVFRREGDRLVSAYSRDLGRERGGYVGQGDLQLVDLDRDGRSEIVLTYDDLRHPLIQQRIGEVIVHDEPGFRTAWTGPVKYDATKAAREVPAERRDRYERELDVAATLRSQGVTLFFNKTVIAVAGERLTEPKVVQETFPLRPAPGEW
jgi:hypothetical protein